jgi:hypothetical protein
MFRLSIPPLRRAALAAAALLLAACGGDSGSGTGQRSLDRVTLTAPATTVEVNGTLQLSATPVDGSGRAVSAQVTWSSSAPAVADVSASGLVTGKSLGSATITAQAGGKSASVQLSVTGPGVASVLVTPNPVSVAVLKTATLVAQARDAGGNALSGRTAQWSSSNTGIAEVSAAGVVTGRSVGTATITATVDGKQGSATVNVTASALNLVVGGMYLSQSVQTMDRRIPLVAGRDGWLRIFPVASQTGVLPPPVRVRIYHSGSLAATYTVPATAINVPTSVDESDWNASWNVLVPASMIRPGLSILADVNPAGNPVESDMTDNSYPADGQPLAMNVVTVPPMRMVLVPVTQAATGLSGNITEATKSEYLDVLRRVYPLSEVQATLRPAYTSTGTALNAENSNGSWSGLLSEINALRVAEGSTAYYYGVVRLPYNGGTVGLGYLGALAAIGYDGNIRSTILAHEVGHNYGRQHAPCGSASGTDPNYPYPGATIGVYGVDVPNATLKNPAAHDLMSYCYEWISDYTYQAVMNYRFTSEPQAPAQAAAPAMLLWGRTGPRGLELEPAFQITTRPSLPRRPGPYTLEALDASGARVFSLSFAPEAVEDGAPGEGQFAFAVPVTAEQAARVATLRVSGEGRRAERRVAPAAGARASIAVSPRLVRQNGEVSLGWDAARFPMVLVRDPSSGHILTFARGGQARFASRAGELELVYSDGVGSRTERVKVQ